MRIFFNKTKKDNLGFAAGTDVEVVGNTDAGMIIAVKGSRVALNRGMASKITVSR